MDYEGLIDDNRVLIACSMNYETAVTFTYGHFNKVVFAVHVHTVNTMHPCILLLTILSSFIKKQRARTDTCLMANSHVYYTAYGPCICWLLSGS